MYKHLVLGIVFCLFLRQVVKNATLVATLKNKVILMDFFW